MDEKKTPSDSGDVSPPLTSPEMPVHDPYPRMIIVCIFISLFLLFIIILVSMVDFIQRESGEEIKPKNPAFFEEHFETLPSGK